MPKTTRTYWNPLSEEHRSDWQTIEGLQGMAEELTLASDEVFIVEGSLYDAAFDRWLHKGDYASRPPGEEHGPFRTDEGCLVLEMSYASQTVRKFAQ